MQKRFHRKKGDEKETAETFGELVMVDHMIFGKGEETGLDGETTAVFIADDATDLRDNIPVSSREADEAELAQKTLVGGTPIGSSFRDRSRELKAMARRNKWVHRRATPHRPEAHGKLEIKIRYTKEATRCNLRQSRLPHKYWTYASRHACWARNVWRKGTDGKSAYERLHGTSSFTGKLVPFGMGIQFRPTKPNREKLLEFDSRAVDGIFLGWDIQPGMTFKGDYLVAAWSDFQALGLDAKVPVHVVREIIVPENVSFPVADAERAMGLRMPLPADTQHPQLTTPENSVEVTDPSPSTGELSASSERSALPFHNVRKYSGSLRAKYAPYLSQHEWVALGQAGRKRLVEEEMQKEMTADEEEVALAASHIVEFCTSEKQQNGRPQA